MTRTTQARGYVHIDLKEGLMAIRIFLRATRAYFQWTIDKEDFDILMFTKKESAPGLDRLHYTLPMC